MRESVANRACFCPITPQSCGGLRQRLESKIMRDRRMPGVQLDKRPSVVAVQQNCLELINERIARVRAGALVVKSIERNGIHLVKKLGLRDTQIANGGR